MMFFLALICLMALTGCPDRENFNPDSTIVLQNMSDKDILFDFSSKIFPDTTIIAGDGPFKDLTQYQLSLIPVNGRREMEGNWIAAFENGPTTPRILFFYSRDTVDHVPWAKIASNYNILKRYDLTKAMLDSLNWTITYK